MCCQSCEFVFMVVLGCLVGVSILVIIDIINKLPKVLQKQINNYLNEESE